MKPCMLGTMLMLMTISMSVLDPNALLTVAGGSNKTMMDVMMTTVMVMTRLMIEVIWKTTDEVSEDTDDGDHHHANSCYYGRRRVVKLIGPRWCMLKNLWASLYIRGFIWDIPILIFAYVLFWGPREEADRKDQFKFDPWARP